MDLTTIPTLDGAWFPHAQLLLGPLTTAVQWSAVALSVLALLLVAERPLRPVLRRVRLLRSRPLWFGVVLGCTLMTSLPASWAFLVFVEKHCAGVLARATDRLERAAGVVARDLSETLTSNRHAVTTLAMALKGPWEADAARVARFIEGSPGVLTMLLADAEGRVVASFRRGGGPTTVVEGAASVADRAYFQRALTERRPFVSDAFRGRGLGTDVIVAVSAPLADGRGVVEASISTAEVARRFAALELDPAYELLTLDGTGHVVFASPGWSLAQLEPGRKHPMVEGLAAGAEAALRGPTGGAPTHLIVEREVVLGRAAIVRLPLAALQAQVRGELRWLRYAGLAGLAFSIALGILFARGLARPLQRLADALRRQAPGAPLRLRTSRVAASEMRRVYAGFRALEMRTGQLLRRLDATLAEREATIAVRTAELAQRNAELEALSLTDALTGVLNRRAFDQRFELHWRTMQRLGQPLALVTVDVDRFKAYNDALGHPAGDGVLRAIAGALAGAANRAGDAVARLGGEEFALLLSMTDAQGARRVAEDARRAIAALALPHPAGGSISASFGVASTVPTAAQAPSELIATSDAALYRAKQAGRDRVSD